MGKLKLLTKSIVFSTRSRRRFFTFVIVFAILSGATIILLNYFDNFSRQELLKHRGVVLRASGYGAGSPLTLSDATRNEPDGIGINDGQSLAGASKVIFYKYVDFGADLRIFSIDPNHKWAFADLKPNNLVAGSFPTSTYQVMVSEEILLTVQATQGTNNIYTKPGIGTSFAIGNNPSSDFELTISGIFEKPPAAVADTREWIFLTEGAFEKLIDEYLGYSASQIYVHSVTIIAGGDVFSGETYTNVDQIGADYRNLNFFDDPIYTRKSDKDELRNMMFLSLVFGVIGTFIVSTLYSYLITRFRRREVAVLKAMGYSKWDVRVVVLSEILVVAVTGFIFGLLLIQSYLFLTRTGSYVYWIINPFIGSTAILSFLAVVISCVPGFFLITARILGIRPIEIFRQK
jgi:hypothetical protein